MNTNTIEQRLLDKELKSLQSEISRGMKIVNAAIAGLPHSHDRTIYEEEKRWILEMFKGDKTYISGSWNHLVNGPIAADFPESMRERILKGAVDRFLESVEDMQEITANLEV